MATARKLLAVMLLWMLAPGAAPASPEALACPDPRTRVAAESPALRDRVCARVEASRPLLGACGLEQSRPITLHVVWEIATDPLGPNCLGSYACDTDEIRVLHPEALLQAVGADNPLARLSADELFDSLVTHELAHALFAQSAEGGRPPAFVDQEYVAYAMQMASLEESARARLLEAHPGPQTVHALELNGIVALAAPTLFAAKAWRHFAQAGNGCTFVGRLVRGETSLALVPR